MKVGKMGPINFGDFTTIGFRKRIVRAKDYEELRPERAAMLKTFHQFLRVLFGLWKASL